MRWISFGLKTEAWIFALEVAWWGISMKIQPISVQLIQNWTYHLHVQIVPAWYLTQSLLKWIESNQLGKWAGNLRKKNFFFFFFLKLNLIATSSICVDFVLSIRKIDRAKIGNFLGGSFKFSVQFGSSSHVLILYFLVVFNKFII